MSWDTATYRPDDRYRSFEEACCLFSVEDRGTTLFLKADSYLPVDTASYSKRPGSSVSQLFVPGISPRRPGFNPGIVLERFAVDKVALRRSFLLVFRFSPVSIIPPIPHNHIAFVYDRRCVIWQLRESLKQDRQCTDNIRSRHVLFVNIVEVEMQLVSRILSVWLKP